MPDAHPATPPPRRTRRSAKPAPSARGLATERKYVSILRADLHRSTDLVAGLDVEEAIARLAPALEAMRAAVHQYHGIIHRELGDGVFAVFGAPVADDLHAVMACLAALDLLQRIGALGDPAMRVRIGVHSGLVVAGPRQLDYTKSYDFDGPPLIMAERLQAAAEPGQALASAAACVLAQGYVHFGPGAARMLKGFPEPVVMHPVEGIGELSKWRVSLARGTSAFVGRVAETTRLLGLAEAIQSAGCNGAVAVVLGEPGVGKSRLAHESTDRLRSQGWQVIEAECSPILDGSPFALLKHLLSNLTAGEADAAREAGLSPVAAAALTVVLHGAASVTEEIAAVWAGLTPRARGRAIVEASRMLAAWRIGAMPTLLLVEDLHWADEASAAAVEVILALAERLPLLVLATARSGGVPAWFKPFAAVQLTLVPLEHTAGLAMLDQLLGASPRLDALKARILAHTGAMPLFIEEVCRGLVEARLLTGAWGAFEPANGTAELGVPPTVQGVIASRIDRLKPPEKRLLQVAAAVGRAVPNRLLQRVSSLPAAVFRQALTTLVAAAMLVPAPEAAGETGGANAFPHELVRQVAYDAVLAADKAVLHSRILAELEAADTGGPISPDRTAALAHHALMAREWSRAADYAAVIARQCLAQAALPDAVRHFELAIGAIDRLPASPERETRAIDLRIEARLAYANFGKVARWLDLAKEAEERARAAGDGKRRITALAVRAAALNFCGAPMEALEVGEAAVRAAAQSGEPGWLAYAEYGLAQARYVTGRFGGALDALGQAYDRLTTGGAVPPGGSAEQAALLCCMMTCIIQVALGETPAAAAAQARADAIAARDGRALSAIAAGYSRGVLELHRDDDVAAEVTLATALSLTRQHEVNLFVPVIACQHGLALLRLGRGADAREAFAAARDEASNLGHVSAGLRADLGLALCDALLPAGRAGALESVQRARQIARQQGCEPLELEALLIEAALLPAADPARARAEATGAALARRLGTAGTVRLMARLIVAA